MRNRFQSCFCLRAPIGDAAGLLWVFVLALLLVLPLHADPDPSSLNASPAAPSIVTVPPVSTPGRMGGNSHSARVVVTTTDNSDTDSRASAIPAVEAEKPKTRLTWEQCVRIALAHNPDLAVFRDNVLNSDAVRRGAYAQLYPQIALSFGATRSYAGPFLGAPASYANEFTGQISLSQTIFNGFLTQGNISQARAELAVAFANLDSQKALTSFDLKTAFAQVLFAQEDVKVTRRIIEIDENAEQLVHLAYDSGTENKGDWLVSKANLDGAIFSYDQALRNVEVSDQQLVVILGQDFPRPLEAVGTLATGPLPAKPDFHQLAIQTPAYFQHRAQVDASAAGITIAQAAFYPTLGFDVSATRGGVNFLPRQTNASGGFTVSYALFDGGSNYFNVRAARASLLAALESLRSGTNDADLLLEQDFKNLVDAVEGLRIQEEQQDANELRYTVSAFEYRDGLEDFEDFNNITTSYVQQLQATLAARQSAVNAEASWEQARGLGAIP